VYNPYIKGCFSFRKSTLLKVFGGIALVFALFVKISVENHLLPSVRD